MTQQTSPDARRPRLTDAIQALLVSHGVPHRVLDHPPATTSEEVARLRGTPFEAGAKALICHLDDSLALIVVPADRRLNSRALKNATGARNVRMMDASAMTERFGIPVGAVPPFGSLLGLKTYADRAIVEREMIAFNIGRRDRSVTMRGPDYAAIERPVVGEFAAGP
ncbi:MAG: YbaK/EbsC family protein [Chloroflexota bacterium]